MPNRWQHAVSTTDGHRNCRSNAVRPAAPRRERCSCELSSRSSFRAQFVAFPGSHSRPVTRQTLCRLRVDGAIPGHAVHRLRPCRCQNSLQLGDCIVTFRRPPSAAFLTPSTVARVSCRFTCSKYCIPPKCGRQASPTFVSDRSKCVSSGH